MFKSGFQPVCVLYQGNQSPFDGSCQLVCRHQIQEERFCQGDTVQVVDLPSSSAAEVAARLETRRAIVMGDEMVSSLLGTLFHATKPEKTNKRKWKKEEEEDEEKQEKTRGDEIGLLHEVLTNVKELRVEVMRQGVELSHIKQRQTQFHARMSIMSHMQNSILQGQDTGDGAHSSNRRELTQEATEMTMLEVKQEPPSPIMVEPVSPIITSVVSTSTGHRGHFASGEYTLMVQEESSPSPSITGDAEEVCEEDMMYGAVQTAPPMANWEHYRSLPSLCLETNEGYLKGVLNNSLHSANMVEIGTPKFKISMPLPQMEDILYKTNNAASFAYRLSSKCFTTQEMMEGNTRGGGIRSDGQLFKQLNPDAIDMIIEEVKKRFPDCASDRVLSRCVKNAINEKARNERKKMAKQSSSMTLE